MALTFIYGNSGSGKSEYIYHRVTELAAQTPYQRYYVVVPEQFTMHTQKRLAEQSGNGVIMNIDVVSFERLAFRVFDELGIRNTVMEETGKSLVLRRIVEEKEQELTVLKGNLKKMGYISELKSMISELMQYSISPSDLEFLLHDVQEDSALFYKLKDILAIYRSFDEYLQENYVTAEKVPELLMEAAPESDLLKGAALIFDGYTGFTPVQLKLIQRLMHIVKDMYVTVTLDTRENLYSNPQIENLFYMSQRMVHVLVKAAGEASFEIAEPIRIDQNEQSRLSHNPVLHHLEGNLFRTWYQIYRDSCEEHIHIYSLSTPKAELQYAAAKICQLVREKGYRYRDFAIVSSNVEVYEKYAGTIFGMYKIPFFVDMKQTILYHPLIEMIRAILEIVEQNYSYESVFRYLRTGLAEFTPEETDLLENYCIEKGIRGAEKWKKRFLKPFGRHGRIKQDEERLQEELSRLNQLRERFWQQTGGVYEIFRQKDATVKTLTMALYDFLCKLSVEEKLKKAQEKFEEKGEEILASEYRQIYKIVIDLLDKMVDLLGDEVMPLSDFTDILEAGFASARVGSIPPGNDCLILGDIERTRLDGIKILFFLGVNDGLIPKDTSRGSILSQYDRDFLEEHSIELAPTAREQVFLQRFYLYLMLTKPSDALYLSYARMEADGKAVRPSYLIGVLQKLFSQLQMEEIETDMPLPAVTPKSGVETYLSGLLLARKGEVLPEWKALHKWFGQSMDWAPVVSRLFETNFRTFSGEYLESDLARLLYGAVLTNSVTRLELFAKCAFAHFLEYGLKLSDRKEFTFESLDMGSMFHAILQGYCQRLEKSYGWDTITEHEQENILKEAMEEAVLAMPNESLLESSRSAYVLDRIYRIMKRSIWALTEQIRRGDFRPEGYELEFTQVSELNARGLMRTVGRVDRIDTYEKDDKIYVKVVDYKSGNTKFQLLQLYYGMQLQLVVYLNAAMEKVKKDHPEKEVIPAGIFYYHLDDPMVEDTGKTEEEIMGDILHELRVNGLVSLEPEAYLHMDRELLQKRTSDVIPLSLNKDLSVSKRGTNAANTEDFDQLSSYVNEQITKTAEQIMSGDINVQPYQLNNRTGCDYCSYKGICGFDQRILGYQYKKEDNLKEDEIWFRIRKENGEV